MKAIGLRIMSMFFASICSVLYIIAPLSAQDARPPAIMHAAPKEPGGLRYLSEEQAETLSDAVAENIARRIKLYSGNTESKPDLSVYRYENLAPTLKNEQDQILRKQYNASWLDMSKDQRDAYNNLLEVRGELAEIKLVQQITSKAIETIEAEQSVYKHGIGSWTKAKITELFSAGLITIDPMTGEAVDKYDNIWKAYAGFFVGKVGV